MTDPITLSGTGSLSVVAPSVVPALSGQSTFVVAGLLIGTTPQGIRRVSRYVGEQNIPGDIKRLRRSTFELMRRMGQPVLIKPMLTDRNSNDGTAEPSPNFDSVYEQTRNRDPLSFGSGFVSKEKATNEWISSRGEIVVSATNPGAGFIQAPKYRGFGPGLITYIIEPDVAEDFYKTTQQGVFIKVQSQTVVAPWYPDINDNDLIINITLDKQGYITSAGDRFQARTVNPVSMRGLDRRGRAEYSGDNGNRHIINQMFEMSLIPRNNILYNVNIDR
jgi:hypothetical protein